MQKAAAGRVALVIGGTGGIGRAVVARLVAQQANVHVLDLAPSADWSPSHSSPRSHAVDVSDEPSVDAAIDAIAQDEGRLDYLVYFAGIFRPHGLMQMSIEDLTRSITINLTGAFLCCRAALRAMRARDFSRIVLISSMLARTGAVNGADYAASKGGLLGLARSLAL